MNSELQIAASSDFGSIQATKDGRSKIFLTLSTYVENMVLEVVLIHTYSIFASCMQVQSSVAQIMDALGKSLECLLQRILNSIIWIAVSP